jgi:SAM-dependent methyltransferase
MLHWKGSDPENLAIDPMVNHQLSAHKRLSDYTSFKGKHILEVGGAQSCESAQPFLDDGAESCTVTGVDHVYEERVDVFQPLRIMNANAHDLSAVFPANSLDVVYGLSIIEHIHSPVVFLEEINKILKPGGLAYFEGSPIWSSAKGHHLWVSTWGGAYQHRTTKNYLFSEVPSEPSSNPLPDWSHLLMSPDQMQSHLQLQGLPGTDIDCILDWVFESKDINRLTMSDIANAYGGSDMIVLEAATSSVAVPAETQLELRGRYGEGIDFGAYGVTYVLAKPN